MSCPPLSRRPRKHPHGRGEYGKIHPTQKPVLETPPRAWGIRRAWLRLWISTGNTPTGVGNTLSCLQSQQITGKHPHGRGEYRFPCASAVMTSETPPRAWGIQLLAFDGALDRGNTPTGVGNTLHRRQRHATKQKHPHGRGEYWGDSNKKPPSGETPPRAWGIQDLWTQKRLTRRNTPTGVGNTFVGARLLAQLEKHPHGRGEYLIASNKQYELLETPPRAWGILLLGRLPVQDGGNTPTGVGNTGPSAMGSESVRKHPHGRGEYGFASSPAS